MQNNATNACPRMLSVHETAKTGILSETALRSLVKQGKIPGIYVGVKFLVNYDKLCEWLNDPENHSGATASKE